jgi:hypothetical protein
MLNKIKSSYILKSIFEFIKPHETMKILNYNKKLQKRVDLSIKDYIKAYNEIIIELKMIDNLIDENNYYFISPEYNDHSLLHIYFNDEFKEQKKNIYIKMKIYQK